VRNSWAQAHLRKWWMVYVSMALFAVVYNPLWRFVWTYSDSTPNRFYVIDFMNRDYRRGDYVAVRWPGPDIGVHHVNDIFIKKIGGLPGDHVEARQRVYFVNGENMGRAKTHSLRGMPLEPGPVGTIPKGHYYMTSKHIDSFDSRYALFGWVDQKNILGRAIPLW
jgi:conjugal transfer pilin signal peptidase TrbI